MGKLTTTPLALGEDDSLLVREAKERDLPAEGATLWGITLEGGAKKFPAPPRPVDTFCGTKRR